MRSLKRLEADARRIASHPTETMPWAQSIQALAFILAEFIEGHRVGGGASWPVKDDTDDDTDDKHFRAGTEL